MPDENLPENVQNGIYTVKTTVSHFCFNTYSYNTRHVTLTHIPAPKQTESTLSKPESGHKDGWQESSPEEKPKCLDRPLVAGSSIGFKPSLHFSQNSSMANIL